MDTEAKNHGAEAMFSALNWIQEQCPGIELSFDMPWTQQLNVERNGIRYAVKQVSRGRTYKYAVGADLGDGLAFPGNPHNVCDDYSGAVLLMAKVILADPRQGDLVPWSDHQKDFTISIKVPSS